MDARPRNVANFVTADGKDPVEEWLDDLRDERGRAVILKRIARVSLGNFGDCESVGDGVSELRIFFGPGYRVYFGEDGDDVILLAGGDKGSQAADIVKAKSRWKEYNA